METCRVRYGIKLFERKCRFCKKGSFWVPKSSHQEFCNSICKNDFHETKAKPKIWPYRRKKKPQVDYVLGEDDYEQVD